MSTQTEAPPNESADGQPIQVVMMIMPWGADSVKEAEEQARATQAHYETPVYVVAAPRVEDLPHPLQIGEIVAAEENGWPQPQA